MKSRFLHFLLSLLLLVSAPVGANVQEAVFSDSDGLAVVSVHSENHTALPAKIFEKEFAATEEVLARVALRFHRRQNFSFLALPALFSDSVRTFHLSFDFSSIASSRIFLLSKAMKSILFIQTVL